MSASCQSNPLQQFVSKGTAAQRLGFGTRFGQNQRSSESKSHSVEYSFLHEQDGALQNVNQFMAVHQPSALSPVETSSNGWVDQFSSMKLEDPLAFDNDYKKLYENYESQQTQQTRQRLPHMSPTLQRTMYHQPVNSYFRAPAVETRDLIDSSDPRFDEEFRSLESELENEAMESRGRDAAFDSEQVEFQRIASRIVESCSPKANSPSPVSAKLYSSKFMSLMRNVSEGSVTLNREHSTNSTEFHSSDGEVVGNEFTPVTDHVHETMKW